MIVKIKSFDVGMEVKNKGIEFEVRSADGASQLGDCYVSKRGLVWCAGKRTKKNGVDVTWDAFTTIMTSPESLKAALKAARSEEE